MLSFLLRCRRTVQHSICIYCSGWRPRTFLLSFCDLLIHKSNCGRETRYYIVSMSLRSRIVLILFPTHTNSICSIFPIYAKFRYINKPVSMKTIPEIGYQHWFPRFEYLNRSSSCKELNRDLVQSRLEVAYS